MAAKMLGELLGHVGQRRKRQGQDQYQQVNYGDSKLGGRDSGYG
jgi:hypothetical protein